MIGKATRPDPSIRQRLDLEAILQHEPFQKLDHCNIRWNGEVGMFLNNEGICLIEGRLTCGFSGLFVEINLA